MFQGGWRWGGGAVDPATATAARAAAALAIVIAIALVAVAWLLSVVIRFALSRKREYLADAGSVELTKDPDAMISALRKIEGRGELEGATSAVMEMCIDNPREGFADLFATHPPIESRIAALIQFAGGHDPGPLELPEQIAARDAPEQQEPAGARTVERRCAARPSRSCRPSRRSRSAAPSPPAKPVLGAAGKAERRSTPGTCIQLLSTYRGNVPRSRQSAI